MHSVVNRDIKPENYLIAGIPLEQNRIALSSPKGNPWPPRVFMCDYGFYCMEPEKASEIRVLTGASLPVCSTTNYPKGSLGFVAPEAYSGQMGKTIIRDTYSLGASLWRTLYGDFHPCVDKCLVKNEKAALPVPHKIGTTAYPNIIDCFKTCMASQDQRPAPIRKLISSESADDPILMRMLV